LSPFGLGVRLFFEGVRLLLFGVRGARLESNLEVPLEVAERDLKQFGDCMRAAQLVLLKPVEPKILILRGVRVIIDSELAELYGVRVKRLNEQVKRNAQRFPRDFVFQLSPNEQENLRSQIATSSSGHGGRRHLPYAFTEHGAIMAATVLNTKRAIEMSVFVVRAFVRLRDMLATNSRVAGKLTELERRLRGTTRPFTRLLKRSAS
jgi:ORF6N domain